MKNEQVSQTRTVPACKIESIKLGIDLHAATAMVVAQFDHALPKPGQRIDTEKLLGWIAKLKAAHSDLTQQNWAVADESLGEEKEAQTCPKERSTRRSRS